MADIFLSQEDKLKVQELFGVWNHHIDPKKLIEPLFSHNMITERDKQELAAKKTTYDKNEYLFDNLLMKAPYEQLEVIYQILMKTGDVAHKGIAARLPRRPSTVRESMEPFRQLGTGTVPIQATSQHEVPCLEDLHVATLSAEQPTSGIDNCSISMGAMGSNRLGQSTEGLQVRSQPRTGLPPPDGQALVTHPGTQSVSGQRLGFYGTKPGSNMFLGKGVCVIIANFTGHLPGYEKDVSCIADFFEQNLGYEVFGRDVFEEDFRNLTKANMLNTLHKIQHYLSKSIMAPKTDRFFLFILSHGDENGIKTCAPGSNKHEERNENGETEYVTPEEIANMFTHDKVPLMEDFPKCIFVQNCRGAEDVQHAAAIVEQRPSRPTSEIAIGADVLLCHATKLGNLSWVTQEGSWFIQTIMETFKAHYENEHIIDLIGEVNNLISRKVGYGEVHGRRTYVKQLPDICYSLRKKFYLSIPKALVRH